MSGVLDDIDDIAAPRDRPRETIDVRPLPPPEPLLETLERLASMDDETVLLQLNDRPPQHLYPKLADRGFEFDTREREACVVTAIWRPG